MSGGPKGQITQRVRAYPGGGAGLAGRERMLAQLPGFWGPAGASTSVRVRRVPRTAPDAHLSSPVGSAGVSVFLFPFYRVGCYRGLDKHGSLSRSLS